MAPGKSCDGHLLSSISTDSCRQVTWVKAAVTPPAPWSCVVAAQNTVIVGRHQRLLLGLTVTLTWAWKQTFLKSIFPKSQALPQAASVPPTSHTEVGLGLKKPSTTVHPNVRTRGRVPVPVKAAIEITAFCTVSAGSYESEAFWHKALTSVHVVRITSDRRT